ncbi:MAG: hypothetical protein SVM86_01180, partial [Candidatus Cloacimonadota bacterium]|nr:hypothetical protein [Candidatus Cloacimonadota bacterium]
ILRPTAEQPQPGGRIILNNRDLVSDGNTTIYEIEDNFDNMLNEMDEIVLGNGRMPDGSYFFSVQVFEPGSLGQEDKALSNIETLTINVNSPTPISLITPGNSIEMGPAVIEDSNPSFVWVSNLSEYNLKIYEIDDVDWVESEIIATQPFFLQENINSTSLLYPASGPELEMGNTYAWQVEAKLSTPFGRSESIKSDLYVFTLEGNSNLSPQAQRLNNFLKQLDLTGAQDALQLLQEGFEPKSVTIDGEETNLNELLEILQKNQNGKIEIKSITIE